jgi:glycosyltransferase involved in cell wall biosynthesis
MSDVGGFREVADHGAAELVAPGDPRALRDALAGLISDPARREELGARAAAAAAGPYSWDDIGRRTLALYERLLG